jgi:hypothetical protein
MDVFLSFEIDRPMIDVANADAYRRFERIVPPVDEVRKVPGVWGRLGGGGQKPATSTKM